MSKDPGSEATLRVLDYSGISQQGVLIRLDPERGWELGQGLGYGVGVVP